MCGKEDAYTMSGRSLCYEHASYFNEYRKKCRKDDEKREKIIKNSKNLRERRKAAGLCPSCGKNKPEYGFVTCPSCRAKSRKSANRYNKNHGVVSRYDPDICWTCNKNPVLPGKRLCKSCYETSLKSLDIANRRRIEMIESGEVKKIDYHYERVVNT